MYSSFERETELLLQFGAQHGHRTAKAAGKRAAKTCTFKRAVSAVRAETLAITDLLDEIYERVAPGRLGEARLHSEKRSCRALANETFVIN